MIVSELGSKVIDWVSKVIKLMSKISEWSELVKWMNEASLVGKQTDWVSKWLSQNVT